MKITDTIRYVGVNDRDKALFENQWPLDKGVTYNSYLIVGEKIALVDTVAANFEEQFIANIKTEIGDRKIDYLIVNHMEPDHSALMSFIKGKYPGIKVIASAKALPMIEGYHGLTDDVIAVKDKEELNLGSGVTLIFKMTPMVHWPETMMTYFKEEETVFSGDAFGCFGAVEGEAYDRYDEYEDEMFRYYSNIVGKYGPQVQLALKGMSAYTIKRICSTHGPIWEKEVNKVLDLYNKVSLYEGKKGVCLAYASMYGNTEQAALDLYDELLKRGVETALHNLNFEHVSYSYRDAFKYNTIVVGSPTYNNDIFPPAREFVYGLKSRLIKNRNFASFGSFTWMGASVRLMNEMANEAKMNIIHDGISFNQGYLPSKCNIKELADSICNNL